MPRRLRGLLRAGQDEDSRSREEAFGCFRHVRGIRASGAELLQPRPADEGWGAVRASRHRSASDGTPTARDSAFPLPQSRP